MDTADLGDGFPDLVAGIHGRTYLLEVKSPGGKERDVQRLERMTWKGATWVVVTSLQQVLDLEARAMGRAA